MQATRYPLAPTTLEEALEFFSIYHNAHSFLAALRWPDGARCPICSSPNVRYLANYRRFQCMSSHARRQFTMKSGTVMQDSAIPIEKWAIAFWCELNLDDTQSSYSLHRVLNLRQATAWHMQRRIKTALANRSLAELPK